MTRSPKFWDSRIRILGLRISKFGTPESQILDPNDTENNDTDYIKTENNDTNDLNDNKLTFLIIIQIIQITTFQTLIMRL